MMRVVLLLSIFLLVYLAWIGPERRTRLFSARWPTVALAIVIALAYLRSPIDLIPDQSLIGFLDDLLFAVTIVWWALQRTRMPAPDEERARAPARPAPRKSWDAHAVLGVRRGASRQEIAAAYRERMKEYHPDRVNGLGEEIQRLAHEKTLEIQRAYEELKGGAA